ncbi:glycosyltransferase family 2 protein [Sphingobium sp. CAP-1]|uniref:glycosyltransferase family 2 protein n=1 Tax=Sphingobium sp. CAP-1 TaxID=2676077 RepID=UPI0012BB2BC6|nr:glycosyltransferase [Sphingobium sp. CAP-1]QGP78202.1 glycosyltransferase [Sphingobium sp. CAP-1]
MTEAATRAISVIIPHYQDLDRLNLCLSALSAQQGDLDFEIVVADNMSPCGEAAVIAAIAGRARLAIATERGAGPTRNAGVAASCGGVLAFTDSDCVPDPGWLAAGVAALAKQDFVGGKMIVLVPDTARMTGAEAFERVFAFNNRRYVEEEGFTVTANLFCPRTLFDRVGGFRTGLSEDLEWCRRATDAGYRIGYVEEAVVGHPARANWAELVGKWRRINAETFGLFVSRRHGRLQWALRNLALPLSVLRHAPMVMRSAALPGLATRLRALGTLARIRLWRMGDAYRLLFRRP